MIFLSHNSKDKPIVEQLAVRLKNVFGQEKVFYDSWSIQPGDGIIDKMNAGLESCKFFFLFVSSNSLNSNMVKLEWQNALMKTTKNETKIIPIRMDASLMPAVLLQTLFLDLYTNGLEITLKQMIDVIQGNNTFLFNPGNFSNLKAIVKPSENTLNIEISAEYYMEPISHYGVLLNNTENDVNVTTNKKMVMRSYYPVFKLSNGIQGNGWFFGVSEATVPGFPFEIIIKSKEENLINFIAVLHEIKENIWSTIPCFLKSGN